MKCSSASDFDDDTVENSDELEDVRRWDLVSRSSVPREAFRVADPIGRGGTDDILMVNA